MKKRAMFMPRIISSLLIAIGVMADTFSIIYFSSILAFVGLGLILWGVILFYIRPGRYVKAAILSKATLPLLTDLEKMLQEFNCKNKGVYLPPKYLRDFESSIVFIPSDARQFLPKTEVEGEELHSKSPEGIFLAPPGLAVSKMLEEELGRSFNTTDLNYIQNKLPQLLVEDVEIAQETEVGVENTTVTVEITNHVFNEICQETEKLPRVHESLGCPLCSAIACALAKATGKPVKIEKEERSENQRTKIKYLILDV